jgi:hypothetical protein
MPRVLAAALPAHYIFSPIHNVHFAKSYGKPNKGAAGMPRNAFAAPLFSWLLPETSPGRKKQGTP